VWLEDEPPAAARVAVVRQDWTEPLWAVAKFASYAQRTKGGALSRMWAQMPELMIAKVAEALALRRAFPAELSGLYTSDEMAQADSPAVTTHAPAPTAAADDPEAPTPPPESPGRTPDDRYHVAEVVELKHGTKNKRAWTLYGITLQETGEQVTTFDKSIVTAAQGCQGLGCPADIVLEQKRYGTAIVSLTPVETGGDDAPRAEVAEAEEIPF